MSTELKSSLEIATDLKRIASISDAERAGLQGEANVTGQSVSSVATKTASGKLADAITRPAAVDLAGEYEALDAKRADLEAREDAQWAAVNGFRVLIEKRSALLARLSLGGQQAQDIKDEITYNRASLADRIGLPPEPGAGYAPQICRELATADAALVLIESSLESLVDEIAKNAQAIKVYAKEHSISAEYVPNDLK